VVSRHVNQSELAADDESNRAITEVIGVDEATVRRDANAANAALGEAAAGTQGRDQKTTG